MVLSLPFRRVVLPAFLLLLASHEAAAQGPEWSDAELVAFSRAIVAGRVLATTSGTDPDTGGIYTYVTIEVSDVIKGGIATSTVTLKQLGGEVGELGLGIAEQAVFVPNEQVVVFLEQRPRDGTLYTTALWQGKWTVEGSLSEVSAVREHLSQYHGSGGIASAASRVRDGRPLAEWLEQLRTLSFARPDPVDAPVLVAYPPETPVTSWAPAAEPSDSAAYVLFTPPWRFHQADTGTAVPVSIAIGGQSGLAGGGSAEITTARTLWNQAASALTLGAGATRPAQCFNTYVPANEGTITISFMDPCGEISDAGGTLAIGGAYYTASEQKTVNGTLFNKALEGMVVNNNSASALNYLTRSRCFQDIQTHELGHVIGLAHSTTSGAIMQPFIDNACLSAMSASAGGGEITGALHQDDINGARFIYPPLTPGAATLVTPSGSIGDINPTFTWNAVGTATHYYLWVNRGGTPVIQEWITSTAAGCAGGSGNCSYRPSTTLSSGGHTWWIQTRNGSGDGAWSSGLNFTVAGAPAPGAATLTSPLGNISASTPTYVWQAVATATSYFLRVNRGSTTVIEEWVTAGTAGCGAGTGSCSYTPSTALAAGAHTWWIQTWNSAGYGPWSSGLTFTLSGGGVPGPTTLTSPSGTISDTTPTFTWQAVSAATSYYLWVNRGGAPVIQQLVSAVAAGCASGTGVCSYTPSTALAAGAHSWWIQTANSAGDGPWSSGLTFTLGGGGVPGPTTLTSPSGTISDTTPTFTWQAVSAATSYYLWVNRGGVVVVQELVSAPTAGCAGGSGTCTFTSATVLAAGAHTWWIQTQNADGNGAWSGGLTMTIAP